jgi:phosphate transport system permease protein/phosphate transport system substrate-binding protein
MIVEYGRIYSNVRINYQSIGSGGGIRQHTNKTVYFAASDAPLTDAQRTAAPNTLHIPITIGCVVLAYNVPGIQKGLNLTGPVIAQVFMGNISKWNDPAIASPNPGVQLPDKDILVVHRSDGSGTTFVFTGYLSTVSSEWKTKVGQSTAVQWPIGLGSAGNEGVAGLVRGTTYTIGYVELAYALTNKMSYAYVQNQQGKFIEPSLASTSAAASQAASNLPNGDESWKDVNLLNVAGADTYPIASFSYVLVYKELSVLSGMDYLKAKVLVDFLWWSIHEGQNYASNLQYVSLPQSVISINEQTINSITFDGQPLRG